MSRFFIILLMVCYAVLPSVCHANGKKTEVRISFHLEVDSSSGKNLSFPYEVAGRPRFFSKSSVLSHKDFIAFSTFPAADGTYGAKFLIEPRAAKRFYHVMRAARGQLLLSQVNGRFIDVTEVDVPVEDQTIVIWRGITNEEIAKYDELLPRIADLEKENRKRREKR